MPEWWTLPAVGFPAVLAARLLAHVRAAQRRALAGAAADARRRLVVLPARAVGGRAPRAAGSRSCSPRSGPSSAGPSCGTATPTINWAVAYVAPLFGAARRCCWLMAGATGDGSSFDRRGVAGWTGLLLVALALVAYPLLPPLFGGHGPSAEVFGIAPDPTAIATLGLLLAARGRLVPLLFPIPLLWLVFSGLTLRTMGEAQAWLPLGCGAVAPSFWCCGGMILVQLYAVKRLDADRRRQSMTFDSFRVAVTATASYLVGIALRTPPALVLHGGQSRPYRTANASWESFVRALTARTSTGRGAWIMASTPTDRSSSFISCSSTRGTVTKPCRDRPYQSGRCAQSEAADASDQNPRCFRRVSPGAKA